MIYHWLGADAETVWRDYQIEEARKAAEEMRRLEENIPDE